MTNHMRFHPEGVYHAYNFLDDEWSMERYVRCLEDVTVLNKCIALAERNARCGEPGTSFKEKWSLRYQGLEILREVDNGKDTG